MLRSIAIAALLLAAAPAAAQKPDAPAAEARRQPAAPRHWTSTRDAATFTPLGVSFPTRAGRTEAEAPMEFSAQGQSLDNGIQYRSRDGEVIATVYVYRPGLAHAGLAHYTTDQAIMRHGGPTVRALGTRIVDAGGAAGVAIRSDYSGYRGAGRSTAAFIKVDGWIVKLRVSGSEGRAGDVDAAMNALLAGIRWGSEPPRQAERLTVARCSGDEGRTAARTQEFTDEQVAAVGVLTTLDGGGVAATEDGERRILPSRVPQTLCLSSSIRLGDQNVDVLRAPAGPQPGVFGRTRLLVPISDNGGTLEVVALPTAGRHVILYHMVGETAVLGAYDGPVSDAQLTEIISGRDREATRIRATTRFSATGGPDVELRPSSPAPEPATPATPTT